MENFLVIIGLIFYCDLIVEVTGDNYDYEHVISGPDLTHQTCEWKLLISI